MHTFNCPHCDHEVTVNAGEVVLQHPSCEAADHQHQYCFLVKVNVVTERVAA